MPSIVRGGFCAKGDMGVTCVPFTARTVRASGKSEREKPRSGDASGVQDGAGPVTLSYIALFSDWEHLAADCIFY